jgi:hypothetical protein
VRACHHGPRGPWVLPRPARAAVDAPALGFARLFPVIPPAGITTGGITGKRRVSAMRRGLEPRLLRARAGAPRRGPRPSPAYPRREAGGQGVGGGDTARRREFAPLFALFAASHFLRRLRLRCTAYAVQPLLRRAGGCPPPPDEGRGRGEGVISNPPKPRFPRGEPPARGAGGQAGGSPSLPERCPPSPPPPSRSPLFCALPPTGAGERSLPHPGSSRRAEFTSLIAEGCVSVRPPVGAPSGGAGR